MIEENLWKAIFRHREGEEEEIEFHFIASIEYEDAFEVLKEITHEYEYDEYALDSLTCVGSVYLSSDDNKNTEVKP